MNLSHKQFKQFLSHFKKQLENNFDEPEALLVSGRVLIGPPEETFVIQVGFKKYQTPFTASQIIKFVKEHVPHGLFTNVGLNITSNQIL